MEANFGPDGLLFLSVPEAQEQLIDDTDQPFFEAGFLTYKPSSPSRFYHPLRFSYAVEEL